MPLVTQNTQPNSTHHESSGKNEEMKISPNFSFTINFPEKWHTHMKKKRFADECLVIRKVTLNFLERVDLIHEYSQKIPILLIPSKYWKNT